MKTFENLTIGSKIYAVQSQATVVRKVSQDGYTVSSGDIIKTITVRNLQIVEKELWVNKSSGLYGHLTAELEMPIDAQGQPSYTEKGCIYFVDPKLASKYVKQRVLEAIKTEEKRIPDTVKDVENNIKSIRQRYYHVLNNVKHDIVES